MKISEIYMMMCKIYGIMPVDDIMPFVISKMFESDKTIGNKIPNREALLVRDANDGIEIGLFISQKIIMAIQNLNPFLCIDEISCAIEGVSHFIYVCDRVSKSIPVKKLELELQAEVDKFIILNSISLSNTNISPFTLFTALFEKFSLDESMENDEKQMYAIANKYAAKYCHHLISDYIISQKSAAMKHDVKIFFNKNLGNKINLLTP